MVSEILTQLMQAVLYGLINGSVIAIGAVGLTLLYGVTRFLNFAYGEFLTYGVYVALLFTGFGLGVPSASIVAIVLVSILGVVVARIFFTPLRDRGTLPLLITSIGVTFILRNLLQAISGTEAKQLLVPLMRPWIFTDLHLNPIAALVLVVSVLTMFGVHILLTHTLLGKKMRATSGNRQPASIAGIDTERVIQMTWIISAGTGALAGILLGIQFPPFRPTMGWEFLIVVFAATLLGGIGKPYGAMLGSLIVGLSMSLGTSFLSADYTMGYAFLILVGVLLVRPKGIAGGEL